MLKFLVGNRNEVVISVELVDVILGEDGGLNGGYWLVYIVVCI